MSQTLEEKRTSARKAMAKKRAENPDIMNAYQRTYRTEHKDQIRKNEKTYREAHREHYLELRRRWGLAHREFRQEYNRKYQANQRRAVFAFYGGEHPECACCGESHIELLTIDHIGGGGNSHRRQIGEGALYSWLIKNNFPNGFRVLCMNCNWSIGIHGYCPHERAVGG